LQSPLDELATAVSSAIAAGDLNRARDAVENAELQAGSWDSIGPAGATYLLLARNP